MKQGLEAGVGLKPQLVIRSLRALTQLGAESDVLQQRAPGLLPLLRHLRKCVGMSEALFLHHVTYLGASQLLFTPLQLAAMAQEGSRSGVSSLVRNIHTCLLGTWLPPCHECRPCGVILW